MDGTIEQTGGDWAVKYIPGWLFRITHDVFSPDILVKSEYKTPGIYITECEEKQYLKIKQEDLKNITIKSLLENLENIRINFEDIPYRQESWVSFKKEIETLWSLATEDSSKSTVLLLMDSAKNLKAEKMSKSHIDGFQKVLTILSSNEIFMYDMFQITKILIDHQIPVLRFPKGASELLD